MSSGHLDCRLSADALIQSDKKLLNTECNTFGLFSETLEREMFLDSNFVFYLTALSDLFKNNSGMCFWLSNTSSNHVKIIFKD